MANTIRIKRGLKANLPALLAGELAYCNDTLELFVGRVNPENGFTENILVNDIPDLPDLSGFYTKSEIAALAGLGLVFQNEKFDADLALESEATTGTDNTKLMTPLRTTQAITAQTSGILTSGGYLDSDDFASQAEAETGTSETTIMSPLRTRESITEILADKTQAEAGLVNNRLMTPLRTAEAIAELSSAVTISTTEPANAKEGDLW